MSRTVALIPARGGSRGLPGKNIMPLMGKPLIHYSIAAALDCPSIDGVYVSTDDPEIAEVARQGGAELPPLRPPELATDTASSVQVARYFLGWYQDQFGTMPETLVLLQPTSPLRNARHLAEAMALYQTLQAKPATVVSVSPAKPIAWQGAINPETGCLQMHCLLDSSSNRQAEPCNYQLNGAIYIAPARRFWDNALMADAVYPYVIPTEYSVDIDTLIDFRLAELLLNSQPRELQMSGQA